MTTDARQTRARAAAERAKRRIARSVTADATELTIAEAAALAGMSPSWMWRRLSELQKRDPSVLRDVRRPGASKPQWRTTLAAARRAGHAETPTPKTGPAAEIAELNERAHRLEATLHASIKTLDRIFGNGR